MKKQGLIPLLFGYFQIIQQCTDKIISFDPSQTALGTGNLIVSGHLIFADISAADHDRDWIAAVFFALAWSGVVGCQGDDDGGVDLLLDAFHHLANHVVVATDGPDFASGIVVVAHKIGGFVVKDNEIIGF